MREIFVGTQEAKVVLSMAVREYAFQVDRLAGIQRCPLLNLLFQSTIPTATPKRASNILPDAFKEIIAKRQPRRYREASAEHK